MFMIQHLFQKCQPKVTEYFISELRSFDEAEKFLSSCVDLLFCEVLGAYMESVDNAVRDDHAGRMEAGLMVEKGQVPRQIQTQHGVVSYQRAYYWDRNAGRYLYAVDELVGIRPRQRLSTGFENEAANKALTMSYEKASKMFAPASSLSRQTVMNKLRQSVPDRKEAPPIRNVPVLHVDADEDHVKVRGKNGSIVPLISIYEGIEDGVCRNIFHVSEYGKKPEDLWEQALSAMEGCYLLDGTAIYLHGDGGAWIRQGMEWLAHAEFVLDKYHKNKYLGKVCRCMEDKKMRRSVRKKRKAFLGKGDVDGFSGEAEQLCSTFPEHGEGIRKAASYLTNHIEGIHICEADEEANRGGCTEGHVSHVLSARLSARPMAWSETTLKALAPLLACQGRIHVRHESMEGNGTDKFRPLRQQAEARIKQKHMNGMAEADSIGALPLLSIGNASWLRNALFGLAG